MTQVRYKPEQSKEPERSAVRAQDLRRIGAIPSPQHLKIDLLGEVSVTLGGKALMLPASRKTRALLAYLVATARPHRRERLCEMFWDIPHDPRGALRTSLSKLRAIVDRPDRRRIIAERDTISIDLEGVDVDYATLRGRLAPDLAATATDLLAQAADSLAGEFIEGLDLSSCPAFHAWCIAEREEARRLRIQILRTLTDRLAHDPEAALPHARSLVTVDPDSVLAHATLMRQLLAAGRQREAEEQRDLSIRILAEVSSAAADELRLNWRLLSEKVDAADIALDRTASSASEPATAGSGTAGHSWWAVSQAITPPVMAERKHVTVLAASVSELALSTLDLDPEMGASRLAPYLTAMSDAVRRHQGTVSQVFADGLVALFGAPIASPDHAVRACQAALAIQASQASIDPNVDVVRIGLDSGEVVVRHDVHDLSTTYQAIGAPVHVARELMARADSAGIRATRRTCDLAGDFVSVRDARPLAIMPGRSALAVCDLVGATHTKSAWQARALRGLSTFVGRETELAMLHRALGRGSEGEGQAVVVIGEPGVGKSRLIHELLNAAPAQAWSVLQTSATSYDSNTPYFAITQLLRQYFEIGPSTGADEIVLAVDRALALLDLRTDEVMDPLFALLGAPPSDDWRHLDPSVRRHRIIQAVHVLLRRCSGQSRTLVVVEDLHWADRETRDTLDSLFERLLGSRLVLIVTCRPQSPPDWMAKSYCTGLRLLPLDAAAAASLAAALISTDDDSASLRQLLIDRTQGTPLFLEELVRALVESGVLAGSLGSYHATCAVDGVIIPPTVQAVLAERIDKLPSEQKALLQLAAVIGENAPLGVLRAASPERKEIVDRALDDLQTAELIYEAQPLPKPAYAFKHPLTLETAYQSLLHERRRQLHGSVLSAMESLCEGYSDAQIGRLAFHALQAGQWEKAVRYSERAAEEAVAKSAYREAARFFEWVLTSLAQLVQDRNNVERAIDVRIQMRPVLTTIGEFDRSLALLCEAEQLAESISDERRMARAVIQRSYLVGGQGLLDSGIEAARRAQALADRLNDDALQISARLALAETTALRADARQAIALVKPIIGRLTGELRHERAGMFGTLSTRALGYLAISHTHLGEFPEALLYCREALTIAEEGERPVDLAYCHYRIGLALLTKGELRTGVKHLEFASGYCETIQFAWLLPRAATALALGYALSGQIARARPLLERAIAVAKSARLIMGEALASGTLADVAAFSGDLEVADAMARHGLRLAREYGYWSLEVFSLRTLGSLAAEHDGGIAEAERLLSEASTLAEARGFRPQLAHCRLALGRALGRHGRAAEAQASLDSAAELYGAMDMAFWRRRARTELTRLRA